MLSARASLLCLLTVLGALLAAASTPSAASAATQRYASPSGSGTACTSADPCDIEQAVEDATSGSEVIVNPGDYQLSFLDDPAPITIRGVAGQRRPRLLFSGPTTEGLRLNDGSTLRYVELDVLPGSQKSALTARNASVDQVLAKGTGLTGWTTVWSENTTIRNSIVVAPGVDGTAIRTEANAATATATYRNVTAIAPESGGVAIRVRATGPAGFANVLARNVIARGGSAGFEARTDNSGATATITVDHSNWLGGSKIGTKASILDGGGNQSAAPVFVNAAWGDYRQAAGSPTIDAGLDEAINGAFDVDGDPRELFGIDIGADEFVVAPAATTGSASAVTDRSASLSGSLNANGAPTSYHFEYGPTTAYGSVTPIAHAGTGGAIAAAAGVGALIPATTYHYRLIAANAGGVTKGADRTFTTAATPAPPTSTTQAPTPTFAGVKPVTTTLTFSGRFIAVKLRCPVGTVDRCSGRTRLTARLGASSGTARPVTVGRAPFSIPAGTRATVKIRVSRAGRRLLGRARRVTGKNINAARDGAGTSKRTVAAVTIRRRHR